jgi:hypothetical protein
MLPEAKKPHVSDGVVAFVAYEQAPEAGDDQGGRRVEKCCLAFAVAKTRTPSAGDRHYFPTTAVAAAPFPLRRTVTSSVATPVTVVSGLFSTGWTALAAPFRAYDRTNAVVLSHKDRTVNTNRHTIWGIKPRSKPHHLPSQRCTVPHATSTIARKRFHPPESHVQITLLLRLVSIPAWKRSTACRIPAAVSAGILHVEAYPSETVISGVYDDETAIF